uniref:BTB/POZ domain-containing family protein n=1 Tax=Rhizophora mucronata TaxID=61149 RepID=A0A2P2L926_RHIMU
MEILGSPSTIVISRTGFSGLRSWADRLMIRPTVTGTSVLPIGLGTASGGEKMSRRILVYLLFSDFFFQ